MRVFNGPHVTTAEDMNVYVQLMRFEKAGDMNTGHEHTFDHMTVIASGSVQIWSGDKEHILSAPSVFLTPKEVCHQFKALEDNTILICVHALRDETGAIIPSQSTKQLIGMAHGLILTEAGHKKFREELIRESQMEDSQ